MPDRDAVEEFYATVNARAEAAILAGEPITGAHHRSLEAEIARHRADRDAAPAAAEGAGTFLKGGRVIEHWADDGDGPVLSVKHGLTGPCNRCSPWALMRLLHAELAARPAPAAASREGDHRPCELPQCDHRCAVCGHLWPCADAESWACRFCGCDIDRHPPMGERSTRYCLIHDMDVCPQYEPSAAREAARGQG